MTQRSTDALIDRLVGGAKPVRPLPAPAISAALWLGASGIFVGAIILFGHSRPDLAGILSSPGQVLLFAGFVLTAIVSAWAAFSVGLPETRGRWNLVPAAAFAFGLLGAGIGCYADWLRLGPAGLRLGTSFSCLAWIVAVALPIDALMIFLLRHAAATQPRLALVLGMTAAAAFSAAALMLIHELESTLMIFVWHVGAIGALVGLAACGAPFFRRLALPR
jgi:hypothetical protein